MSMSDFSFGKFPDYRPRRMRATPALRNLIAETRFSLKQLVMPYFVREGEKVREEIAAMPGQYRFSPDTLLTELDELTKAGISAILLFGIPAEKDEKASFAWKKNGIVQRTVKAVKKEFPELLIITDVCLCAYMSHGHCGWINSRGEIDNDASLKILSDVALSHAEAGAGMVAPSDMMDGRIGAIRRTLDQKGFSDLPVMSYSAKYASGFYGPFRDAAHSTPKVPLPKVPGSHLNLDKLVSEPGTFGRGTSSWKTVPEDRKTYQMDFRNRNEALREIAMDIEEGADIVMVKPALAYLDIIREASDRFRFPLAAYAVSGEYTMIKAADQQGFIDEHKLALEVMTSIFRAGASTVITYHAKDLALRQASHNIL